MIDDDDSLVATEGDDYVYNRSLSPEENLLAAIVHRALLDAQGYRLGSDSDSPNNHIQREARKWFRDRDRLTYGGWGWVVDALEMPKWMERRVVTEASITKVFTSIKILVR